MSDPVDQEIEAIKNVLQALTPLSPKARASVLEYVVKRLDLALSDVAPQRVAGRGLAEPGIRSDKAPALEAGVHIKELKARKKPRSANEMAALVAYYLGELVPLADRKKTVNHKDIETYFKIAQFPLPDHIGATLANAKTAGYFDSVGEGEYRLNAVGHNLVVHSMPRGKAAPEAKRPSGKKAARKRVIKKSARTTRS